MFCPLSVASGENKRKVVLKTVQREKESIIPWVGLGSGVAAAVRGDPRKEFQGGTLMEKSHVSGSYAPLPTHTPLPAAPQSPESR